jgi:hypothetical protein
LTAPAAPSTDAGAAPRRFIARLQQRLLWLIGFSSGFVVIEPAPYEFIVILAFIAFAATGMSLKAGHLPLLFLLIFYNIGCVVSLLPVIALEDTAKWTAVTCFLAVTSLFFAIVVTEDTERRLDALLKGYILCAVVTSIIAILAYFKLIPGWELFIGALRAKSTFKDPNVFGPFLILPALIVLQRMMFGRMRDILVGGFTLLIIAAGLLLSFSRGAWGHFAASAVVMLAFMCLTTRSARQRLRILIFAMIGGSVLAVFIVALLSLDQVADLFKERASLVQSYDAGHLGRFGRHILGALMVFDHPEGIGPLQFSRYLPEDPHNSFLDAFMAGGWLGGVTYLAIVLVILVKGLRHVFVATPWQTTYIAIYAAYVGEVGESYIIDVQHWRHYFLIVGLVWGLMILRRPAATAGPATAAATHAGTPAMVRS